MNKIEELIQQLCPNGVEYKELGEIFENRTGFTPSKKTSEYWENGTISWYTIDDIRKNGRLLSSAIQKVNIPTGKTIFPRNSIILSTIATIGEHALVQEEFLVNQQFIAFSLKSEMERSFDVKFLYYYFFKIGEYCRINTRAGSVPTVNMSKFYRIPIPVPPLEIQKEIVKILDKFTKYVTELTSELTFRKQQYSYYRDKLLSFEDSDVKVEWKTLGEIFEIVDYRGKTPAKVEKGIFLVTAKNVRKGFIDYNSSQEYISHESYDEVMRRGKPKIGDILITTEAPCGNVALVDREDIALAQRIIKYSPATSNIKTAFYKHYLLGSEFQKLLMRHTTGGTVKGIKGSKLHQLRVPLPPLHIQEKIVEVLDNFDKVCNDLNIGLPKEIEQRQQQYEYYRDLLLTFDVNSDNTHTHTHGI
ncbi:restriction endonuclease subunit S [Aerococcaceae bacterium NML201296]|nr:restriction endonuclease subunit S [Aerococcaceae bacterium NML201296]